MMSIDWLWPDGAAVEPEVDVRRVVFELYTCKKCHYFKTAGRYEGEPDPVVPCVVCYQPMTRAGR